MYELRRLTEVWPTLRGSQSLKGLLQEHCTPGGKSHFNVWVHPGHVIIAFGHSVLSLDVLPRSKHLLNSASSALTSQDHSDVDWLCLKDCAAPLVHVFCPDQDHSLAGLVFGDGKVEFWRFKRPEYKWVAVNFIHLMTTELLMGYERVKIESAEWLEDQRCLVACYSTPRSFSRGSVVGERPASNRFSVGAWKLDSTFQTVESCLAVFTQCPVMCFTQVKGLVCCHPGKPTLTSLLLFWMANGTTIQPYICGSTHANSIPELPCPVDFTDLVTKIVGTWLQQHHSAACILALTSYRWSNEILMLADDGCLTCAGLEKDGLKFSKVAQLQPWSPSHADGSEAGEAVVKSAQMLAQRNCLVLVQVGMPLRIFDIRSGRQLWQSIDMQLEDSLPERLWQFPTVASSLGAWNRSGIWMLQSKPVLDQAESVVKPSDLNDLSNEDAVAKCCSAAWLCLGWNLHAAAARFSLQGASLVSKMSKVDGDALHDVPDELISLLDQSGLESPALLLPALIKFPSQRQRLVDRITVYLKSYKSADTSSRLLHSSLAAELLPLLQDFLVLAGQYKDLLGKVDSAGPANATVGDIHNEVLHLVNSQTVISGSVEASQVRLDLLSQRSPALVLATLKEFLDVPDFNEALAAVHQDSFQSCINWESVLVRDVTFMPSLDALTTSRFPLFELLCRLLHSVSPEELVAFVEFASHVVRHNEDVDAAFVHHDKDHYFVDRALAALPIHGPDSSRSLSKVVGHPDSVPAMLSRAQLLQRSGRPQAALTAVRYLASCHLWSHVFDIAKVQMNTGDKDSAQSMELFHMILVALIESNQLHKYWQNVLSFRPSSFTLPYFLNVLHRYTSTPDKSQVDATGYLVTDPNGPLTVDVVRGMLCQML